MDKKNPKERFVGLSLCSKDLFNGTGIGFSGVQDLKRSSRGAERTPNIHGKREEEGMKSKFSGGGGGGRAGILKVRPREIFSAFFNVKMDF
jgi:hypothetical protein